jgi:hypothetical protein
LLQQGGLANGVGELEGARTVVISILSINAIEQEGPDISCRNWNRWMMGVSRHGFDGNEIWTLHFPKTKKEKNT